MTNNEINLRQMLGRNAIYVHVDQGEGYRQFWVVFNTGTHKYILQRWSDVDNATHQVDKLRRSIFFLEHKRSSKASRQKPMVGRGTVSWETGVNATMTPEQKPQPDVAQLIAEAFASLRYEGQPNVEIEKILAQAQGEIHKRLRKAAPASPAPEPEICPITSSDIPFAYWGNVKEGAAWLEGVRFGWRKYHEQGH